MKFNNKRISCAENKTTVAWSIVKEETGNRKQDFNFNLNGIQKSNKIIKDPKAIADLFNDFFLHTSEQLNLMGNMDKVNKYLTNAGTNCTDFLDCFKLTTSSEIRSIISELKNSRSSGWDGIPSFILKICKNSIVGPLSYIINISINKGIFPDLLKYSIVRPIYKKGDKTQLENFRRISLLPVFSKVYEKLICNRLVSYLETINIPCISILV